MLWLSVSRVYDFEYVVVIFIFSTSLIAESQNHYCTCIVYENKAFCCTVYAFNFL